MPTRKKILTVEHKRTLAPEWGQRLSYLGFALTAADASINGIQNHHYADLGISVGLIVTTMVAPPVGVVMTAFYISADLTSVITTNKSVTERLFDKWCTLLSTITFIQFQ